MKQSKVMLNSAWKRKEILPQSDANFKTEAIAKKVLSATTSIPRKLVKNILIPESALRRRPALPDIQINVNSGLEDIDGGEAPVFIFIGLKILKLNLMTIMNLMMKLLMKMKRITMTIRIMMVKRIMMRKKIPWIISRTILMVL